MKQIQKQLQHVDIGPARLAVATMESALAFTETFIDQGASHYLCFCEANLLSVALRDPKLSNVLKKADAVFADGIAVKLLANIRGYQLPERVPGPSFLLAACKYGIARGWRHFFYGGTARTADLLVARLTREFPGIQIAGTYNPPFRPLTEAEEAEVKAMVETSGAHLLWVGLGGPKQEFWCAQHVDKIHVPVMLAVGAAFDFHSGQRPWAPSWIRRIGMEWVYRTLTGGKRTLFRNFRCISIVAFYLLAAALERLRIRRPREARST
jgi:N-acetylglucosaminyldiphosphoundecaprenol N-acetyl-beta-D-mannosaminyltransferase